jgi:hypothetical protein
MPALWQCNISRDHRIIALVTRLKFRGRLNPKQIVVAAMRKAGGAVLRCSEDRQTFRSGVSDGLPCQIREWVASGPGLRFIAAHFRLPRGAPRRRSGERGLLVSVTGQPKDPQLRVLKILGFASGREMIFDPTIGFGGLSFAAG